VNGGEIVAEGTPEQVAAEPKSFTGAYLAETLKKSPVSSEPVKVPKPSKRARRAVADEPDLLAVK
jgi:excinuclease ABC subunit A